MKLVMAVSVDGFVARDERDDMSWTGPDDKRIFRILTGVDSSPLAVSLKTRRLMPAILPGRDLYSLSTGDAGDGDLLAYHRTYPLGWLIGGQTVAVEATRIGLISEVHICESSYALKTGIQLNREGLLAGLTPRLVTDVGEATLTVYR